MYSSGRGSSDVSATKTLLLSLCGVLYLGMLPHLQAQNFVGANTELRDAAEQARVSSATFWTGAPLPDRWSQPCPIEVVGGTDPPSGLTRFQIAGGEVFGWAMQIRGSRSALIADVIPHEVDHMVRASLIRRPIPRWLDEGCASLMESAAAHQKLRQAAQGVNPAVLTTDWLDELHYPPVARQRDDLYALGFSLTEFLLQRGGPAKLLDLQRAPPPLSARIQQFYELSARQLREEWNAWRSRPGTDCQAVRCALHRPHDVTPPTPTWPVPERQVIVKPKLTIWTAGWCRPCREFWTDWQQHAEFRELLCTRFELRAVDFDRHRAEAQHRGILSLPSFELSDRIVAGYPGREQLLIQLGLVAIAPPAALPQPRELLPAADSMTEPVALDPVALDPVAEGGSSPTSGAAPGATVAENSANPSDDRLSWEATDPPPEAASPTSRGFPSIGLPTAGHAHRFWAVDLLKGLAPALIGWGGTLATGGVGGVALTLVSLWIKRRFSRGTQAVRSRREAGSHCPFPRRLEEAGELLELAQTEGRVAALDALRGMFLDDELEKLASSGAPAAVEVVNQLRSAISRRVDEVAPISTRG